MSKFQISRCSVSSVICLATLAMFSLYGCGSPSAPTPPIGTTSCNSDAWCRTYAKRTCADNNATKCVGGECIYVLKIANTPPNMCISGDVRTCNLGGTSTEGIETCAPLGGTGGGCNWGTCGPL
jgi:hypothetical protein